jgi:hypothetical protein
MGPSIWDILAGTGLSVSLLTIVLFGSWRFRRHVFLAFCVLALSAFAWHAGCWYHQFSCSEVDQLVAAVQG